MIGKEYKWYAIYVIRNHERRVNDWLISMGLEVLFPTNRVRRVWSDRVKIIEQAMFPSYLFVRVSCVEYFQVLNYPSIIKYVSFNGKASQVPDCQINLIRSIIDGNVESDTDELTFIPGQRVLVAHGPMKGVRGLLEEFVSSKRLLVRIDVIGYSLLLKIPETYLLKESEVCELAV